MHFESKSSNKCFVFCELARGSGPRVPTRRAGQALGRGTRDCQSPSIPNEEVSRQKSAYGWSQARFDDVRRTPHLNAVSQELLRAL